MDLDKGRRERHRITVTGVVQGVGFRPFVYNLALRLQLTGQVGNDASGVFIEVEGSEGALATFRQALTAEAPPLSRIQAVHIERVPVDNDTQTGFFIAHSEPGAHITTLVSPDVTVCEDCLREFFDPADRRYRYPFINCTNCGPRFTIVRALPYDRPATTMTAFAMCPASGEEYTDPHNRRFHAQPNACPDCGPQVWFLRDNTVTWRDAAVTAATAALRSGEIVAVKGVGGIHIACDATNPNSINRLRERKKRPHKPFAVMVRDIESARTIAVLNIHEERQLIRRERPILLLKKRDESAVCDAVAPGTPYIGVMLPYAPLHYLLLEEFPLVMTSGNVSGEPIIIDNGIACERLAPLVDAFLLHNRPIYIPCDDSVVGVMHAQPVMLRRSRGYAPLPLQVPPQLSRIDGDPVLAVGGELKNTFCLLKSQDAFLSQHIGDMANLETLNTFSRAVKHFIDLYGAKPRSVVCDLHPGYMTTQWANQYAEQQRIPLYRVQHHHAHVASLMCEHGIPPDQHVIGLCYDGTGYGSDGTIWGGEILLANYVAFRRAAYLRPFPLAGGDASVVRPYRLALAYLWQSGIHWDETLAPVRACPQGEQRILSRQFETGFQTVPCSSMGRLFDAVASLIGLSQTITYEAQAAIALEGLAARAMSDVVTPDIYNFGLTQDTEGGLMIDPVPVIRRIVEDLHNAVASETIAARFHWAVAGVSADVCVRLAAQTNLSTVGLSGGVFQNSLLLEATLQRLKSTDLRVLTHHNIPPNDGSLALGQAVIATARQLNGQTAL